MSDNTVFVYDTTLRDGTQREGFNLSLNDKLKIAQRLDDFGVHYIEGGWPGSNPKDVEFFRAVQGMTFRHAKVAAFGSTRRKHADTASDPNICALMEANTPVVTLVGKSWDLHVRDVLETDLEENLAMISDSVAYFKAQGKEVIYDAEHFFDGYKANPEYALLTVQVAARGRGRLRGAVRHQRRLAALGSWPDCARMCESSCGKRPSAFTPTTTAAAAWPTRWRRWTPARCTCRAPSTATASAWATPTFAPSCRICS